jgi:hypothetical protein
LRWLMVFPIVNIDRIAQTKTQHRILTDGE